MNFRIVNLRDLCITLHARSVMFVSRNGLCDVAQQYLRYFFSFISTS